MIIMRRYIYISILMIVSNVVFGQESQPTLASPQTKTQAKYIKEDRKKGLIYKREFTIGGKITSNGWGITANVGKILNIHNTRIFEFEFDGIKDPRQEKQSAANSYVGSYLATILGTPKDFYYGMQNQFFTLRAGYGYKYNIAEKAEKSGVALDFVYVGGVTLGLLKPYYLQLEYLTQIDSNDYSVQVQSERYNPNPTTGNAQTFLDWNSIFGASGFGKGLNEIQPLPGIYGKAALNFEWGAKDNFITALEAGVALDLYYKKVPIMIDQTNHFMFWNVFLAFQLGKRS